MVQIAQAIKIETTEEMCLSILGTMGEVKDTTYQPKKNEAAY